MSRAAFALLESALRDLRYSLRLIGSSPGYSCVAIATLALGIGTCTAMFSVVHGVLVKPLPYLEPDRLVHIRAERAYAGSGRPAPVSFTAGDLRDLAARLPSLESLAFHSAETHALSRDGGTEVVAGATVSGEFFSTLRGNVVLGRPLGPADDAAPAVVISERLWSRAFGRSPDAVGEQLTLSSEPYVVVGVAGDDFRFPTPLTDVWTPAGYRRITTPACCSFLPVGRLKPAASVTQARTEVDRAVEALAVTRAAAFADVRVTTLGLHERVVADVQPALALLSAAVGLVLVVACANSAHLLSVWYAARASEFGIRFALGASRRHLVSQMLVNAVLIAVAGAAAGVLLAIALVAALKRLEPAGVPRLDGIQVDAPVLLFALGMVGVTTLCTGLWPSFRAARPPAPAHSRGGSGASGRPELRRVLRVLCVSEMAIALVLLLGASLLGRSLVNLVNTDVGVDVDNVTTATLDLTLGRSLQAAQSVDLVDRVVESVGAIPGVQAAGVGASLPPNDGGVAITLRRASETHADYRATGVPATPGYFEALRIPLVRGRFFTRADGLDARPVVIVSEDAARSFFGDGVDPLGQTVSLPVLRDGVAGSEEMTVVGLVGNVKYAGLGVPPDDTVYRPFAQQPWSPAFLLVRSERDGPGFATTVRRRIAAADPGLAVRAVEPLESAVSRAAAVPRVRTALFVWLAGLGVALAAVGFYGVLAYSASQRTNEIGVRMALGATRTRILGLLLRESATIALLGTVVGLALAFTGRGILAGFLYGVEPTDPGAIGLAVGGLAVVAAAGACLPVRRALRVDPVVALRMR